MTREDAVAVAPIPWHRIAIITFLSALKHPIAAPSAHAFTGPAYAAALIIPAACGPIGKGLRLQATMRFPVAELRAITAFSIKTVERRLTREMAVVPTTIIWVAIGPIVTSLTTFQKAIATDGLWRTGILNVAVTGRPRLSMAEQPIRRTATDEKVEADRESETRKDPSGGGRTFRHGASFPPSSAA